MVWFVRSQSQPNLYYMVHSTGPRGVLRCQCPAAQYRPRKPCRHCAAVVAGEARPARLKAA